MNKSVSPFSHDHRQFWEVSLTKHNHRKILLVVLILLLEFEVEFVSHHRADNFQDHLSKRFAKADTFTTTERQETHRVPLLTLWSLRKGTVSVKAIWYKLVGTLPLLTVSV